MASSTSSAARGIPPHAVFYPAASLHAAIVLPLSVLALAGSALGPSGLGTAPGHAREMLAGYALAVVAGNQLPPQASARLATLVLLWLSARVAALAGSSLVLALDGAFALVLAGHVVPRLAGAAKKWRNAALPALLAALCTASLAAAWLASAGDADGERRVLAAFVRLLAALMLFMGGRIVAPAAAGQIYRQGGNLVARVQPRIEGALIVAMAIAVGAALLPGASVVGRAACGAASALALVRLARWRPWALRGRPDILALAAGYAWLALGLAGLALAPDRASEVAATHAIVVGAMGTLTLNVMGATVLRRARRDPARSRTLAAGTLLVAVAAGLRIAAAISASPVPWLIASAAAWSAAFVALLALLAGVRPVRRPHHS